MVFKYAAMKLNPCKHSKVSPKFDPAKAKSMTSQEVRKHYPRFEGICPDCNQKVIMYNSLLHYVSGDW